MSARFTNLQFQGQFRKYQQMVLDILGPRLNQPAGDRFHIVAPPGSGKTIVGLELARQLGNKTVIFAPTTTIQQQWVAKLDMFGAPQNSGIATTSPDPLTHPDADIRVYTYQLISVAGAADDHLREAGRSRWMTELLDAGIVNDETEAQARIDGLATSNREAYRRDLARHVADAKRQLLREPSPDLERLLHPNARKLIDDLVAAGVRTVILDECHHLLDYWAIVLSMLISKLDAPHVIGLTATLPSPDDDREYDNYMSLLGDVDFEVPTPAVVREGNLAPYRNLVHFVEPSDRESAYLRGVQEALDKALAPVWSDPRLMSWLLDGATGRGADPAERWTDLLRTKASFSIAALRHFTRTGAPAPQGVVMPDEAHDPLGFDDIVTLAAGFGLHVLKPSADPHDHQAFAALKRALLPFGITLTERGARQQRSPGDLVLAYSETKAHAVSRILHAEAMDLGERFRGLVLTDFERSGSRTSGTGVDSESGSCRAVFAAMVQSDTAGIDPVMVTGRTLWIDADHGPVLTEELNRILERRGSTVRCKAHPTKNSAILEIRPDKGTWNAGTYVAVITEAFERGLIRCLVGTRGLFSEGWDALTLNTLVDLTTAATSTTTQQLRGRSARLDPAWERKVAHNWDVICVAPQYAKGDQDFRRLVARHGVLYGVVPKSKGAAHLLEGRIERGIAQIDSDLDRHLRTPTTAHGTLGTIFNANRHAVNQRSLDAIGHRERSYDAWGVGDPYDNFHFTGTRMSTKDTLFRTAYTVTDTLKAMLLKFRATLIASVIVIVLSLSDNSRRLVRLPPEWWWAVLGLALTALIAINASSAVKVFRAAVLGQPRDDVVRDVGRAVAQGLVSSGLISRHLTTDYVRVAHTVEGHYEVLLDYADAHDAEVFATAMAQVFGPVRSARYLILRDTTKLPEVWLRPLWAVLRRMVRKYVDIEPAYHPVPDVLGARKERAEAFAQAWMRYVGGGELVFTGTLEGWRVLQQARGQKSLNTGADPFSGWR